MKTTISFGKIAYYGNRKINAVSIEIEIKERECINFDTLQSGTFKVLSICGNIWNNLHTDIICGGQCLDEIKETPVGKNPKFLKIFDLWQRYHLNDLKAGTKKQCEAIVAWRKENNISGWGYEEECEFLKSINLYDDNGIKYGNKWLCEEIPAEIIKEIEELNEIQ